MTLSKSVMTKDKEMAKGKASFETISIIFAQHGGARYRS